MSAAEPDPAVDVEWLLEGPRESLDTFGWPDLRELVDRITSALEAMPGGPAPGAVLPIAAMEGSVRVATRMRRSHLGAVDVLRRGPAPDWTPRQRQRAEALYGWTRSRGATLSVGAVDEPMLAVAVPPSRHGHREATTLRGQVHRAGGRKGVVDVEFPGEGIVACKAGTKLAAELGGHLYRTVDVTGVAQRDALGRLAGFELQAFEIVVVGPASAAFAGLHEAVGTDFDELDPEAVLAELRS